MKLFSQTILFLFVFALCWEVISPSFAQDERFYRQLFDGSLARQKKKDFVFKYEFTSPEYMIDLNRDGVVDSFQTVKKDGVDFIRIMDANGMTKFEASLEGKGKRSRIFKAHLLGVSGKADVLILHYYEGDTDEAVYEGSARIYVLTIEDKNLNKISMTKGPHFFHERESADEHYSKYWNRRFVVNTVDYNSDGIKEISVSFNSIHRIMTYNGSGVWTIY